MMLLIYLMVKDLNAVLFFYQMKLTYALKYPNSHRVQRLVRRFGSYVRLLIVLGWKAKIRQLRCIQTVEHPRLVRCILHRRKFVDYVRPFEYACCRDFHSIIKLFLACGTDINAHVCDYSSWKRNLYEAFSNYQNLLNYGGDPNKIRLQEINRLKEYCNLYLACGGDPEPLKNLKWW